MSEHVTLIQDWFQQLLHQIYGWLLARQIPRRTRSEHKGKTAFVLASAIRGSLLDRATSTTW